MAPSLRLRIRRRGHTSHVGRTSPLTIGLRCALVAYYSLHSQLGSSREKNLVIYEHTVYFNVELNLVQRYSLISKFLVSSCYQKKYAFRRVHLSSFAPGL
jgi:hypothetical protein